MTDDRFAILNEKGDDHDVGGDTDDRRRIRGLACAHKRTLLPPLLLACLKGCFSPLIVLASMKASARGCKEATTHWGKGEGKDSNSHAKSSRDFTITILDITTTNVQARESVVTKFRD